MKKLLLEFKSNKRIPSASKLDNRVEQDLKLLKKRQHSSSGGSGFWNVKEEDDISVFISVYVAHCLTCCQERGFSIDVILKRKVTEFLSDSNIISWCQRLHCTNPTTLTFIRAFALYMRQRLTPSKLDVVVEQVEAVLADAAQEKKRKPKTKNFHAVSLECLGLLLTAIASIAEGNQLPSLASDIKAYILNNVTETAETAHFVLNQYDNDDGVRLLLHSNFRTDAICLESLMTVDPSNTLIPKIVKGLLADRREGHWSSTQADCWVLLSLIRYFEKYEAVVPDFEAELWLGDTFVGEQAFRNRSTEQHQFEVPMSYLHCLATANEEKKEKKGETEKNKKKKQAKEQEKGKEKEKEKDKETAEVKDKDNDKKEKKEKREPKKEKKHPRRKSTRPRKNVDDANTTKESSPRNKSNEEGKEPKARDQKKNDLILAKQGEGRLYYRLGLNYSPTCCVLPPIDRGFSVRREFECVDDVGDLLVKEDTSLSSPSSRTIFVKAGKRIRIRVTFTNSARRYHVAMVDQLGAGLEPLNPNLKGTEPIPPDSKLEEERKDRRRDRDLLWHHCYYRRDWWDHENMRDERVEAFTTLLWEGEHHYSYVARATTIGTFTIPPTKVEEMYSPEVFGRSVSDRLVVVADDSSNPQGEEET